MTRRIQRRRGATVIELAICMVILGIALPPLVGAFADASRQSMEPAANTVAGFLAIERMEQMVARRYRGTDGYSQITEANFPAESPVTGFSDFSRSVTVSLVDSNLTPTGSDQGYKKVRVTVTWQGGTRSLVIERVFAEFLP